MHLDFLVFLMIQEWFPDYLSLYFGEAGSDKEFTDDDDIIIGPLGYFEELDEFLANGDVELVV